MISKGKLISQKVIVKNIEGNCRAVIQNTVQGFARLDCGNKEKPQLRQAVSGSRAAVLSRTACVLFFSSHISLLSGHTVSLLVGHCAISRKIAGSIPDGVIGILNPCGRTVILGSTHSVTEMSTRNISWG